MKVVAYHVTARRAANPRGFRRCGRWFPVGQLVRVDATALTTPQAELLAGSNPRDLLVEVIREAPPKPGGVIVMAEKAAPPEPPAPGGVIIAAEQPDAPPKKGRGR